MPKKGPRGKSTGITKHGKRDRRIGPRVAPTNAKITEDQVIDIYYDTRTRRLIAEQYGISLQTIYAIKNKSRWSRLLNKYIASHERIRTYEAAAKDDNYNV